MYGLWAHGNHPRESRRESRTFGSYNPAGSLEARGVVGVQYTRRHMLGRVPTNYHTMRGFPIPPGPSACEVCSVG